ncbi:MAG TPA: DHH family phosphoesterase, partial [Roseiflexaceae bacterium]|nr:DHH family phosphoesterase [Roseiflexaceae bacterium]
MILRDPVEAAPLVAARLAQAETVLLLTHLNPDGDAIGSLLAAWHAVHSLGKQAIMVAYPSLPAYTGWLPGVEQIMLYRRGDALPAADMVLMLDTANLERLGPIYDEHRATLANLPLVIVDHHMTNDGGASLNIIDSTAASTCELLYALLHAMQVPITPACASCLLLGLTTDTQSFQTSATSAVSLRTAAMLYDLGADRSSVVREVYYALPASSAALIGMALAGLQYDQYIAWVTVTNAMMAASGAEDEAADEVVRVMQRIAGIGACVLFKERGDGTTKLSLRSRPPHNVAHFAQQWGGGG